MRRKLLLFIILCFIIVYYLIQNGIFSNHILTKPNVVMIIGDAVRPDMLSMYGGDAVTPNLDWVASQGVVFENAFSNSPWTAPASASIFTGNYATTYKTKPFKRSVQLIVPDEEFLFSELLASKGYVLIKNIENWNADINNALQGFSSVNTDQIKTHDNVDKVMSVTGWYAEGMNEKVFPVLEYLININTNKPFFLAQWFLDPHAPYIPNRKFREKIIIDGNKLDSSIGYFSSPQKPGALEYSDFENLVNKSLYVAEVESVDERIGFILEALKFQGGLEKTIFIFLSDHGEEFGEHGHWGHGGFGRECSYYNTLMRVPLIIAGPGVPKGKRISSNVALIDLMPTINELLGGRFLEGVQGESLVPVMQGKSKRNHDVYFSNVVANQQVDALLSDNYKLISMQDGSFKLFDVLKDVTESRDLSGVMPRNVESMRDKLLTIRKENEKKRIMRKGVTGFQPKSKSQENEIVDQLKSLGYMK